MRKQQQTGKKPATTISAVRSVRRNERGGRTLSVEDRTHSRGERIADPSDDSRTPLEVMSDDMVKASNELSTAVARMRAGLQPMLSGNDETTIAHGALPVTDSMCEVERYVYTMLNRIYVGIDELNSLHNNLRLRGEEYLPET